MDRGKSGAKRSVLAEAGGAPLSVVVTGANTHDKTAALATPGQGQGPRPEKVVYRLRHLRLDKGYDYEDVTSGVRERDHILHLKRRGVVEPSPSPGGRHPARRWVVERTHAWRRKFRRLLVRREKKVTLYEAMVRLARVLILYRLLVTS